MGNTDTLTIRSHDHLSRQLVEIAKQNRSTVKAPSCFSSFIQQYYAHASLLDLSRYPLDILYGKVHSMWEWLHSREQDACKVRVYRAEKNRDGWRSPTTLIEIVMRDMPFIVDSVHMALSELGYVINFTINIGGLGVKRKGNAIEAIYPIGHLEQGADLEAVVQMEIDHPLEAEECQSIQRWLLGVLSDVQLSVNDWGAMLTEATRTIDALESTRDQAENKELSEAVAFIKWLCQDNFTFLGHSHYDIKGEYKAEELILKPKDTLGLCKEWQLPKKQLAYASMPKQARKLALSGNQLIIIQKTNEDSRIHRPGKMDRIIIKRMENGVAVGQRCFVGLFTSMAYHSRPKDVPILRQKISAVLGQSGFLPKSHAGKALVHILDTLPRDDLFQATVPEIEALSNGILQMQDRSETRLFIRKDACERYYSCLVYMPNEVFKTDVLFRIQRLFSEYFDTQEVIYTTHVSETVLASIHFMVTLPDGVGTKQCDVAYLEKEVIKLCRSWRGEFRHALIRSYHDYGRAKQMFDLFSCAFPSGYQEVFSPEEAAMDVDFINRLNREHDVQIYFYQLNDDDYLNFKLFSWGKTIHLSDVLPMLENMGLKVIREQPHCIELGRGRAVWLSHFQVTLPYGKVDLTRVGRHLEETFSRVWTGHVENDSFNRLVILTRLTCKDVMVLRSYARYLRQLGFTYSQSYISDALLAHPDLAELLAHTFNHRFDPHLDDQEREKLITQTEKHFKKILAPVSNLDFDRIFRCLANVITATLRTNYFQSVAFGDFPDYISFKIDCRAIVDIAVPKPLPMFDTFVCSCKHAFEGIHLRDSKVARGGIRRSDRREDYRTEVAGLQRAQQLKNGVIVPSGAKGAFVLTDLSQALSREAEMASVINAYQYFIRGLLDLTDNLLESGEIITPDHVVCYDDSDHYFVVAADKGTATFSDIANEISNAYGYWLGDAFASGGATGYDHKRMGITAKGAWIAVQHHFHQMGIDVQKDSISVVGIGDMGGDVFGNGMLLSDTIQLKAAFNHLHIFLDPNPEPKSSYKERKRLFQSAKYSWADYKKEIMSKGAGVFDRSAKQVKLTAEMKKMLDVEKDVYRPDELIRLLLKSKVDLIWNGGIGTYVKASSETNQDAEDAANNHTRVSASELRCKVFAEGGNLGLTQKGRVEFALVGGCINTDFIDNSAGVDCSDHEVNIKILLDSVIADKKLTFKKRNTLLSDMTEDISHLVLANNVKQNRSIHLAAKESFRYINLYQRYMAEQEEQNGLDRDIFGLPSEKELMERKSRGVGLTRPEIAVLLAHSKNHLKRYILASGLCQNADLNGVIASAFPDVLRKRYQTYMDNHQLADAIIATQLSNQLVDDMGVTFIHQMQDETGATRREIVIAYVIARQVYGMEQMIEDIAKLSHTISPDLQAEMMQNVIRLIRRASRWFLRNRDHHINIAGVVKQFRRNTKGLVKDLLALLSPQCRERLEVKRKRFIDAGVPQEAALTSAALVPLYALLNVIESSMVCSYPLNTVASAYFAISNHLDLIWLRERINEFPVDDRWAVLARATVKGDLDSNQRLLAVSVLQAGAVNTPIAKKLDKWLSLHQEKVGRWLKSVQLLRNAERHDFAMLTVVNQELTSLAKSSVIKNDQ